MQAFKHHGIEIDLHLLRSFSADDFDWDGITLQNMLRPLLPQNEVTVNAALEYRPYMNDTISIRNEIVINRAAFEHY